jgi:hypothetical protein
VSEVQVPILELPTKTAETADMIDTYDPPLDPGISDAVEALRRAGVETYESCQGGEGHAYPEPTVRFHGEQAEGFRALAAALASGLRVAELRRVWTIQDQEPIGPWWELTFRTPTTAARVTR